MAEAHWCRTQRVYDGGRQRGSSLSVKEIGGGAHKAALFFPWPMAVLHVSELHTPAYVHLPSTAPVAALPPQNRAL